LNGDDQIDAIFLSRPIFRKTDHEDDVNLLSSMEIGVEQIFAGTQRRRLIPRLRGAPVERAKRALCAIQDGGAPGDPRTRTGHAKTRIAARP